METFNENSTNERNYQGGSDTQHQNHRDKKNHDNDELKKRTTQEDNNASKKQNNSSSPYIKDMPPIDPARPGVL